MRVRVAKFLLLILLAQAAGGAAGIAGERRASEPLRASMIPAAPRCRSQAPFLLEAELAWDRPEVLRGRLEIAFVEAGQTLGVIRGPEMALVAGRQRMRLTVPPAIPLQREYGGRRSFTDIRARFHAGGAVFDLGARAVSLPGSRDQRWLLVAVCIGTDRISGPASTLAQGLRLEELCPQPEVRDKLRGDGMLGTYSARLRAETLPADPLDYCAFDALLLAGDGLAALRKRQLSAILRWVRAGGSVLVLPGDQLSPRHAAFASAFCGDPERFSIRGNGELLDRRHGRSPNKVLLFRRGLGRAALLPAETDADALAGSFAWKRVIAFLFKVRAAHAESIAETGAWSEAVRKNLYNASSAKAGGRRNYSGWSEEDEFFNTYAPLRQGRASGLVEDLLPHEVQLIPFWLMALLLALFVIVIGPVDYLLLGKLRRRYLTWIFFPAASILFTLFAKGLADRYMGANNLKREIAVVDVDAAGSIRSARYELAYPARNRILAHEIERAYFTPMDAKEFQRYRYGYKYRSSGRYREAEDAMRLFGSVPRAYAFRQQVFQWQPQLNRMLSFGLPEELSLPEIDWKAVGAAVWQDPDTARRILRDSGAENATVGIVDWESGAQFKTRGGGKPRRRKVRERFFGASHFPTRVDRLSMRDPVRLFGVVSAIAPNAADDFEDLAIFDQTDPDARLALALYRQDNGWLVIRRLFHRRAEESLSLPAAAGTEPQAMPGKEPLP